MLHAVAPIIKIRQGKGRKGGEIRQTLTASSLVQSGASRLTVMLVADTSIYITHSHNIIFPLNISACLS